LIINEDSATYKSKKSFILSLFSVETIVIVIVFYLFVFKYNTIIVKQNIELDLIVISISSVLLTTVLIILFQQSIKLNVRNHISIYLSDVEKGRLIYNLNKNFSRIKLFSLITFIPFVILVFAINQHRKASVSLFIDNSGSTSAYIDYGRSLLINATQNIEDDTKFIITNFSDNDEAQNLQPKNTSLIDYLEN
jgi:nitrogen fixation/metabolism regulation signal transduction histidine kinase